MKEKEQRCLYSEQTKLHHRDYRPKQQKDHSFVLSQLSRRLHIEESYPWKYFPSSLEPERHLQHDSTNERISFNHALRK